MLCILSLAPAFGGAEENIPSLEEMLTVKEYRELRVDNLDEAQREALRRIILEKYNAGFQAGKKSIEKPRKAETETHTASAIESRIDGDFEGWEGETMVKLMNGQIWQQSEYYYEYHYAYMPNVVIYRSGGGYKMKVEGIDRAIGVTRLK